MHILKLKPGIDFSELEQLYKQASDKRTSERLHAIYLRAQGKTPPEIAAIVGRHVKTVRTWIKLFNAGGEASLEYKHSGGPAGKLGKEQEDRLVEWLKEFQPDGQRWTLNGLAIRLQHEYGVRISQQQISQRILQWNLGHLISRPRRKKACSRIRRDS